jgi:hypothetical protein
MASLPGISANPKLALKVAVGLWIAFAIVVWNVVFDRVIVLAGRRYVYAASVAAAESRGYVRAGDWMQSATTEGLQLATLVAGGLLLLGLVLIGIAWRRLPSRRAAIGA